VSAEFLFSSCGQKEQEKYCHHFVSDQGSHYFQIRGRSDYSKLQGDLNFVFDQQESVVNLHKAISLPESPCVRPYTFQSFSHKPHLWWYFYMYN